MKKVLVVAVMATLLAPIAAWAIYRPMRVLAPEWVDGIVCVDGEICLEDVTRYREAKTLYDAALGDVASVVGAFRKPPRVVFCATEGCYRSFGFAASSATDVGTSGIVVSPRGWTIPYLRHEMIHHRQGEELGVFALLFKPEWLIEGMAYALSDDPRQRLSGRWQRAREKFRRWWREIGRRNLWEEARKI